MNNILRIEINDYKLTNQKLIQENTDLLKSPGSM